MTASRILAKTEEHAKMKSTSSPVIVPLDIMGINAKIVRISIISNLRGWVFYVFYRIFIKIVILLDETISFINL